MGKSVLFHPGEGSSVPYTIQDEKPQWYRLSCIPVCVSLNAFLVKSDPTQLFKVV